MDRLIAVHRRVAALAVIFGLCVATSVALTGTAAAVIRPANDDVSSAPQLSSMASTISGTSVYATHSASEPTAGCGNNPSKLVWFRQTIPVGGDTINVDTVGSNFDTVLVVYKDNGAGLTQVTCGDDSYGGLLSSVSFAATSGTYYYGVGGFNDRSSGFVRVNADIGAPLPPGTSGSSTSARTSSVPGCVSGSVPDKWYRFIGAGGTMTIDTSGSNYDTVLTVMTFPGPQPVACNDDVASPFNLTSQVSFAATAGQRYYVLVSGFSGATGLQTLHVNGAVSSGAPATTPAPPVPVAPTSAAATANLDGSVTLSWTGPSGMSGFDITRGADEATAVLLANVDASVTSFLDTGPGSGTQHYWLYAVNSAGRSAAAPLTVTPRITTTVQLTPSSNSSDVAAGVTFSAQVAAVDASGPPTGTVTFRDGTAVLGAAVVSEGLAQLTTSALAPGAHSVTATYNGDATYAISTSAILNQQVDFSDVRTGAPFYADIYWLTEHKITTGFADGTFRPATSVTRQAFAAYLYRYAHGGTDAGVCPAGTSSFPDVPDSSPFCGDIKWLAGTGITGGFADGTFRGTNPVARQAVAAFLYRYNHGGADGGVCPAGTSAFNDVADTSPFCMDIKWLATTSPQTITTGFADGGFHPTTNATRQATAAYLHRYDADFGA
jgi:hypothetical protein